MVLPSIALQFGTPAACPLICAPLPLHIHPFIEFRYLSAFSEGRDNDDIPRMKHNLVLSSGILLAIKLTRFPRIRFAMLGPISNFADFGSALYMLVKLMLARSPLDARDAPSGGCYLNWSWPRLEDVNEFANIVPMQSGGGSTEILWRRRSASQGFEIRVVLAIEA